MDKIKAGIVGLGFGKHIVSCVMSCMLALFVPAAVSTAASSISGEVWVDANSTRLTCRPLPQHLGEAPSAWVTLKF
jgi:hypothetical protein